MEVWDASTYHDQADSRQKLSMKIFSDGASEEGGGKTRDILTTAPPLDNVTELRHQSRSGFIKKQ